MQPIKFNSLTFGDKIKKNLENFQGRNVEPVILQNLNLFEMKSFL